MSQMKKMPSDVKKKSYRVNTLDKHILPKLEEWWGGKERLLSDLFATNYFGDTLQNYLKQTEEKCYKLYNQQSNIASYSSK
jgi:hypothetical protein